MKKIIITISILLVSFNLFAITIEADAPTKLANGNDIPIELSQDLRGTLYMKQITDAVWSKVGTTTDSTFSWSVPDPAAGAYLFRATAQFLDNPSTESDVSSSLTYKVYGVPMPPTNLRIIVEAILGFIILVFAIASKRKK